ncbi:hypothetical protein AFI02nite_42320 [Aliivibrio fischeri]|uniref:Uncharacterized protein n=1 Tax=Aliivibrio fischeri TaxID=668 RepID=A0A510UP04_ALIFS|nr:hypothetical protein AFI02nite_42320 [Aliivibrio fischeri]
MSNNQDNKRVVTADQKKSLEGAAALRPKPNQNQQGNGKK